MLKAGIIGATGYAGVEIIRILLNHPQVEIAGVSSVSFEGQHLEDIYAAFRGVCERQLQTEDDVIAASDVVFAAVPHGLSEAIALKCQAKGAVLIDIGADFRLADAEQYAKWYGGTYSELDLHAKAVYSIPELHRAALPGADIIANPGCYPTSVALALYPAVSRKLIQLEGIIADCKSGTTGAGRVLRQTTHFADANENFTPYAVARHRHNPEIEQTLSALAGEKVDITFVPHLLPMNRGILSTVYSKPAQPISIEDVYTVYNEAYAQERFVRVLPLGAAANVRNVQCSNFCDISLHMDKHTGLLIVVSAIDNMVKGAAGQAVQNMNIRFGLDEGCGLNLVPISF